jgi:hypothetical protein
MQKTRVTRPGTAKNACEELVQSCSMTLNYGLRAPRTALSTGCRGPREVGNLRSREALPKGYLLKVDLEPASFAPGSFWILGT